MPWHGRAAVLALLCCALTSAALGQRQVRLPVTFKCTCDDVVGSLYATAFRDLLATSPRFIQVNRAEEKDEKGKTTTLHWNVSVVSVDEGENNSGDSSALSIVFLIGDDIYITQRIQTCGRNRATSCASATLAALDNSIQSVNAAPK
jgi:hypothetical protein